MASYYVQLIADQRRMESEEKKQNERIRKTLTGRLYQGEKIVIQELKRKANEKRKETYEKTEGTSRKMASESR